MKSSGNTVLIIGGSAGIGFELARKFSENNNQVIITGRSESRLISAASQLKNVTPLVSDFTNAIDVEKLVNKIESDFSNLNLLINNAALATLNNVVEEGSNGFEKAREEMHTNYFSVARITEKMLPLLKKQDQAAIVNVTSIAAFLPGSLIGYSASKAALRSYTISLRMALEDNTMIKVFELVPPLVNTDFSKEIGGTMGISPKQVADEFFPAFENDEFEIQVGQTKELYRLYMSSPADALGYLKKIRKNASSKIPGTKQ
jgi:uncharacterized oxidoreductase